MPSDSATYVYFPNGFQMIFDRDNWILSRTVMRTRQSDGEEYEDEETLGYYSDPGAAARSYLMHHLHEAGEQTIADFIETVEQAQKHVTEAIAKASGWPVSPARRRMN